MTAPAIITLLRNRVQLQKTAAASLQTLFAGVRKEAADKTVPQLKDILKAAACDIEVGKIFGVEKKVFAGLPMPSPADLGFTKMKLRVHESDAYSGTITDAKRYERWALPLRPLTTQEKTDAVFSDLELSNVVGAMTAGSAVLIGTSAYNLVTKASSQPFVESAIDAGAALLGLGLGGYLAPRVIRHVRRAFASATDETLVAVLPAALNTAGSVRITGADMQANLMKVQLGRTPMCMPKTV